MASGTVKWFNAGQALSYEVTTERGKTAATNLKLT
jgi:cold shock CspA family protein